VRHLVLPELTAVPSYAHLLCQAPCE
jgi:hypothetical protein